MAVLRTMRSNTYDVMLRSSLHSVEGGGRTRGNVKACISNKPLITIITVVLNGEKFLEQTIQSVVNQKYSNLEYIIIDGGSSDGTLDIIRKYDYAIDYWVSEKDEGIYCGMNKGVALALGDWIGFINADDYLWSEDVLERISTSLERLHPDICIAYGQIMLLTYGGEALYKVGEPWEKIKKRFHQVMLIPHQGVMHHRNLFERNGGFDESFRIVGDYEMLLRELKIGNAVFLPDIIFSGTRQGGISNRPEQALSSLLEVRRAQKMHGLNRPGIIWVMAMMRVFIRLLLWRILGELVARKVLDLGRRIMGLPACWAVNK
jgi:glycosyltransferase involved in cell wall biosynthesis